MNTTNLKFMYTEYDPFEETKKEVEYNKLNGHYIRNNHCRIIRYMEHLTYEIKMVEKSFNEKEILDKIKQSLLDNKRCEKFNSCSFCKHEYFKSYEGN